MQIAWLAVQSCRRGLTSDVDYACGLPVLQGHNAAPAVETCALSLKLFTGTAGVPPAVSVEREQNFRNLNRANVRAPDGASAGGTPAVPVKSLSGFVK